MRWLAFIFVALIVALQYPMWLGKGGWLQVRELDKQVAAQRAANAKLITCLESNTRVLEECRDELRYSRLERNKT